MHWFGEPPAPGETLTELDVPELGVDFPPPLAEACASIYEIADREGMALEFSLEAGDMLVIDNKSVAHGRAAFAEDPGDIGRRLLYRLQFELQPERPTHAGVACYYNGLKRAYRDPGSSPGA